jgi:ATP-dependent DNA ligase
MASGRTRLRSGLRSGISSAMFVLPCLPTASKRVPTGPEWIHEIKHDGYRLIVRRDFDRVRLYSRRGSTGAAVFR